MKKFLALILALSATFCLVACEDGKCDECGRKGDDVKVYEGKEENYELCGACALEKGVGSLVDSLLGGK